jgi:hypothetical protein
VFEWSRLVRSGQPQDAQPTPDLATLRLAYEEVRLIGPRAVVDAALSIWSNLERIVYQTRRTFIDGEGEPADITTYAGWWKEHVQCMEDFLAAAREDLGVEPLGDSVAR